MLRRMNLSSFLMVSAEFFTVNYFVVLAVILLILDGFNQHYQAFVHFLLSRVKSLSESLKLSLVFKVLIKFFTAYSVKYYATIFSFTLSP